jgi:hypothetical protein
MTTKELVENFRFKEKTTQRDSRGSGETNINKRGERTTYLNLERNLSSESNRAYHALKDKIKNE